MVSVVIPAYNEEKALPYTLAKLLRQPGDFEVIVVDGGSTDRTPAVLAEFSFSEYDSPLTPHSSRRALTAFKGRASQMNAGAKEARGEWLLFLHADTVSPTGAIRRLNGMEADHMIQAGGFMHQFSGDDWRLRLISFLGACPTLTVLLRQRICDHLRRSRPEKILNVFQRIRLRFFQACSLASGRTSFTSS